MTATLNLNRPEPPPYNSTGPAIWPLVIEDMYNRALVGLEKYGQPLKAFDGRKSLVDCYQEALDLVVYLRKEIEEAQRNPRPAPTKARTDLEELAHLALLVFGCNEIAKDARSALVNLAAELALLNRGEPAPDRIQGALSWAIIYLEGLRQCFAPDVVDESVIAAMELYKKEVHGRLKRSCSDQANIQGA